MAAMESQGASSYGFSTKEKNALVLIYKEEIMAVLRKVTLETAVSFFKDCFDDGEMRRITSVVAEKGENAGKETIFNYASRAHDPRVFVQVIEIVKKIDTGLAKKLLCNGIHDAKHYQSVLAAYPVFNLLGGADFLGELVLACSANNSITAEVCERVLNVLVTSTGAATPLAVCSYTVQALSTFLQHLPYVTAEWYWLFMRALDNVPHGRQLRDAVNKDFEDEFNKYEFEKIAIQPDTMTVLNPAMSFEDWLQRRETDKGAGGATSNIQCESIFQSISNTTSEAPVTLRRYQIHLASAATSGKNAVICAPTGSGKTYVAAEIIRRHFDITCSIPKKKKAIFLVPTVQLIDQQYDLLKAYLPTLNVKMIKGGETSGAAKAPKAATVLSSDVVVTTPQLLLNELRREPTVDDDITITLQTLSLIIFDECHHCDKDHPYNQIMVKYLDAKLGTRLTPHALPQVVGLTASLGVGKADDEPKALEHVVHLSANMDTHILSTIPEEHRSELADLVNVPRDRVVSVKEPPHPLAILIEKLMAKIEKMVESDFNRLRPYMVTRPSLGDQVPVQPQPPCDRVQPQYTCWVCTWLARLPEVNESQIKPALTSALEHLRIYNIALQLNGHIPPEQALRYLEKEFEVVQRKQTSDRDRQLVHLYNQELLATVKADPAYYTRKNQLVEKLAEIVVTEFRERPDARILVFVATRELTIALEEYMKSDQRLKPFNAARLTGVQAKREDGGQTVSEQQDLLERFRNGYHQILVATTVAEEGLDVEKCHLVIKYNHVTNEIAMVQRRGRGRAVGSECILLVKDDWILRKEETNILREYLMDKAVNVVHAKGQRWFRESVEKIQKEEFTKRSIERALAEQVQRRLAGKRFDMLCRKCNCFIVSTENMRKLFDCNYVAVDPSIWHRLCLEPNSQPMIFQETINAGKVSCSSCRADCGIVVRYRNAYLPSLKIAAVSLQPIGGGQRVTTKKWKDATTRYFAVHDLANSDLRDMHTAIDQQKKEIMDVKILLVQTSTCLVTGNGCEN